MQSVARITVSAIFITSVLASSYHSSAKLRRDGVLNLYPFPRVGRAQKQTWQVPLDDLLLEDRPEPKRQLYAFPRVGRTSHSTEDHSQGIGDHLLSQDEHSLAADNTQEQKRQLYAFPRVGRSEVPLTLNQLRAGPEPQPQILLSSLFQPRPLQPQPVLTNSLEAIRDDHRLRSIMELILGVRRNSLVKRVSGSTDTTGMWFGPRLGRAKPSDDDEDFTAHNQTNERREPVSMDETQTQQEIDVDGEKTLAE